MTRRKSYSPTSSMKKMADLTPEEREIRRAKNREQQKKWREKNPLGNGLHLYNKRRRKEGLPAIRMEEYVKLREHFHSINDLAKVPGGMYGHGRIDYDDLHDPIGATVRYIKQHIAASVIKKALQRTIAKELSLTRGQVKIICEHFTLDDRGELDDLETREPTVHRSS